MRIFACEQGGRLVTANVSSWANTTVSFIKAFKNTNTNVIALGNWSNSENSSCTISDLTTTNFKVRYAVNTVPQGVWYAVGFVTLT